MLRHCSWSYSRATNVCCSTQLQTKVPIIKSKCDRSQITVQYCRHQYNLMLRIHVFWNLMLCFWVSGYWHYWTAWPVRLKELYSPSKCLSPLVQWHHDTSQQTPVLSTTAVRMSGLAHCSHIQHTEMYRTQLCVSVCRQDRATPLFIAAQNGHLKILVFLLSQGATPDSRRTDGATPLWIAAQMGHDHIVWQLLKAGATVDARRNVSLVCSCSCGSYCSVAWDLVCHSNTSVHHTHTVMRALYIALNLELLHCRHWLEFKPHQQGTQCEGF
jgi:hypothetical protein